MVDAIDASSLVYHFLRSDSPKAVAIQETCVLGRDSIIEAGQLFERTIRAAFEARSEDPSLQGKVLLIIVQDAGDAQTSAAGAYDEFVVVRVGDRGKGYLNIRKTKNALKSNLREVIGNITSGGRRGASGVRYVARTGHRFDPAFRIEYDALSFALITVNEEY